MFVFAFSKVETSEATKEEPRLNPWPAPSVQKKSEKEVPRALSRAGPSRTIDRKAGRQRLTAACSGLVPATREGFSPNGAGSRD